MTVLDSKTLRDAYKDYQTTSHYGTHRLKPEQWKAFAFGEWSPEKKKKKWRSKKVKRVQKKRTWLEIHREFLRWKKTPEFEKWKRKQFLKQGGTCYYCDEPLSGTRENIEHVIPKIRGGDNRPSNLVLACWRCNKEKYIKILPQKERQALEEKNRKKKGTYLKTKAEYSEIELGYKLREMFRD